MQVASLSPFSVRREEPRRPLAQVDRRRAVRTTQIDTIPLAIISPLVEQDPSAIIRQILGDGKVEPGKTAFPRLARRQTRDLMPQGIQSQEGAASRSHIEEADGAREVEKGPPLAGHPDGA